MGGLNGMIDLRGNPFYLKEEDIKWIRDEISRMTPDEKVGQLFCMIAYSGGEDYLKKIVEAYKPGGVMCSPMPLAEMTEAARVLQQHSRLPVLIAANLEHGGSGIVREGTSFGSQMNVAATNDDSMAYRLGTVCGREGAAAGVNWAFSPVIDIDFNFRNPILNTRTFGSDPDRVKRMGVQFVKGLQEQGVAASIKHFPGDGTDERDQHLVTTINNLSCEEWDRTYGAAYRACIDAGALTVMAGHIMQPAYSHKLKPALKNGEMLPASLSQELITELLRKQLGFNGLVVTDASTMAGMAIPLPREKAVPAAIAAGCDMFLFTRNPDEDFYYMKKGIQDGIITEERLTEALTRILALKASLKLHKKQTDGSLIPAREDARKRISCPEHEQWARECADRAITLVKSKENIFPILPGRYKKILLYGLESEEGFTFASKKGAVEKFKALLQKEGFEVDEFKPSQGFEGMQTPFSEITEHYDLILYVANLTTTSVQTTVRIEWAQPMGANVPVYISSVPTVFISLANPYHLLDVPRVRTYINAYAATDIILEALVEKLAGRSEFKGICPVDAFCGKWDTKL
jgi:beta-N-acetylhexosaminidase